MMEDSRYYHRIFPSLAQSSPGASNGELLRPVAPAFTLSPPRGQRIPVAQLLLEQEMAQASGRRRKRR